jgi:hypothetical protein
VERANIAQSNADKAGVARVLEKKRRLLHIATSLKSYFILFLCFSNMQLCSFFKLFFQETT